MTPLGFSITETARRDAMHTGMKTMFRIFTISLLLAVLGFCVFGFIATFEALPAIQRWVWRTVYGLVGMSSVIGLVRPLRCQWRRTRR